MSEVKIVKIVNRDIKMRTDILERVKEEIISKEKMQISLVVEEALLLLLETRRAEKIEQ